MVWVQAPSSGKGIPTLQLLRSPVDQRMETSAAIGAVFGADSVVSGVLATVWMWPRCGRTHLFRVARSSVPLPAVTADGLGKSAARRTCTPTGLCDLQRLSGWVADTQHAHDRNGMRAGVDGVCVCLRKCMCGLVVYVCTGFVSGVSFSRFLFLSCSFGCVSSLTIFRGNSH